MCRVLYRFLASLARLAVRSGHSKDLEFIVLRHQLTVLHRQNNRPALADEDRTLLGAIAARAARQTYPDLVTRDSSEFAYRSGELNALAAVWLVRDRPLARSA